MPLPGGTRRNQVIARQGSLKPFGKGDHVILFGVMGNQGNLGGHGGYRVMGASGSISES